MADDAVTPSREIVTRAEARAAGLKYYFTGKPCPRGHVDTRLVKGGCVPCDRERSAKNYLRRRDNPEYVEELRRKNTERMRVYRSDSEWVKAE